jgi:hypothetical protein
MPQRASVFCNFYIRVDREALVSERALDVGSVAFKAMSTKIKFYCIQEILDVAVVKIIQLELCLLWCRYRKDIVCIGEVLRK